MEEPLPERLAAGWRCEGRYPYSQPGNCVQGAPSIWRPGGLAQRPILLLRTVTYAFRLILGEIGIAFYSL